MKKTVKHKDCPTCKAKEAIKIETTSFEEKGVILTIDKCSECQEYHSLDLSSGIIIHNPII